MQLGKHETPEKMRQDLEILHAKLNALEIYAKDEFQKGIIAILRHLVQGQSHSINEFGHLKKAIDLLTVEMFKISQK